MSLTWANARRTVRRPTTTRRNVSITEIHDSICKTLDDAAAAYASGAEHRCVQPNQDDPSLIDVSAIHANARLRHNDDGTTAITVKPNKKEIREACELWKQAVNAGDCDNGIKEDSQRRKAGIRAAWAKRRAASLALVPVKTAVRR